MYLSSTPGHSLTMSDPFRPGSILWIKFGVLHWPATVVDTQALPEDVKDDLGKARKQPDLIVKFFNEDE